MNPREFQHAELQRLKARVAELEAELAKLKAETPAPTPTRRRSAASDSE